MIESTILQKHPVAKILYGVTKKNYVPPSISSPPAPAEGVFSGRLLSVSSRPPGLCFWLGFHECADLGSYGSSDHLRHALDLQM